MLVDGALYFFSSANRRLRHTAVDVALDAPVVCILGGGASECLGAMKVLFFSSAESRLRAPLQRYLAVDVASFWKNIDLGMYILM